MSKAIVTFAKNWRGYASGETAGFDEATAAALMDAGYAVEYDGGRKPRKTPRPVSKAGSDPRPEPSGAESPDTEEKP